MDKKKWEKQGKKIAELQENYGDIHIFHGLEANIKKNGELDIDSSFLKEADVVLASIHSSFRLSKKEMTDRVIKAVENEYVNILSHPTGRKIQKKEAIHLDLDAVFESARKQQVAIEINAYPERLDLNDVNVHRAIDTNVKLSIGTDAHRKDHLRYYTLGTAVARRGWAQQKDIINTFSLSKLKKFLNKKHR
jgi:DNA polymerase (family X)